MSSLWFIFKYFYSYPGSGYKARNRIVKNPNNILHETKLILKFESETTQYSGDGTEFFEFCKLFCSSFKNKNWVYFRHAYRQQSMC